MTESDVPARFSDPAQFILHPTDFSAESNLAFAHALRLALTNNANLSLLHVADSEKDEGWDQFPSVRRTLQDWGLLEEGARQSEVYDKLGVGIEKLMRHDSNVVRAIADYLHRRPIDVLVLATAGRRGVAAWLKPSSAERAARKMSVPTLFVPAEGRGCVSLDDGQVTMDQVLIPVDHKPPSEAAIERGLRAIEAYGHENSKLTLLHVGPESQFPNVQIPSGPWQVTRAVRQGNPVSEILAAADECVANLLIMVTQGSDGFLDILRGTTTEQVLRQAPCPVLSIPADF